MLLNTVTMRCLIGFAQGIFLYFLYCVYNKNPLFIIPITVITVCLPLIVIQAWDSVRVKALMLWGGCVTICLFAIYYYAVYRQIGANSEIPSVANLSFSIIGLVVFTQITLFIAHSMFLSSYYDGKMIANYSTYFDTSWKLKAQMILTGVFVYSFWLFLFLGASLFSAIHLSFFEKLIGQEYFCLPATTLAIAISLHITDVSAKVTYGVRSLIFLLFSWLLPLITLIVSSFLIGLFFTGLTPLWEMGHTGILLFLAQTVLIILINAVYQEGTFAQELSKIQRVTVRIACLSLAPLAILVGYALMLRVQQYGWSISRIYAAVFVMIGAFYAGGYSVSALFPNKSKRFIHCTNISAALLIVVAYFALNTPLADPARLSVNSQLARLESGQVSPEQFDFVNLRQDGLIFGKRALEQLEHSAKGSHADLIKEKAHEALTLKPEGVDSLNLKRKKTLIISHTADGQLPESFFQQDWSQTLKPLSCLKNKNPCHAWLIKGTNNKPMLLLLDEYRVAGLEQDSKGIWNIKGYWDFPYQCQQKMVKAMQNQFTMVTPSIQNIKVNGIELHFQRDYPRNLCD